MAEHVQWDDVATKQSADEKDKSEFLRLQSGKTYKIRPVFKPVKFWKYFLKNGQGKTRTAIVADPSTCPVRERHPELKPSLRYAAIVIDREDNKVKILEAPQSVFRSLGTHFEATGKNPGGSKDGSDWQIKVTGKGLNTTYDVIYLKETPLSDEEKNILRDALEGDKDKLQNMFKADTPDEIEEKLFGKGEKSDKSSSSTEDDLDGDSSTSGASSRKQDLDWV